jgi:hypothetical protein
MYPVVELQDAWKSCGLDIGSFDLNDTESIWNQNAYVFLGILQGHLSTDLCIEMAHAVSVASLHMGASPADPVDYDDVRGCFERHLLRRPTNPAGGLEIGRKNASQGKGGEEGGGGNEDAPKKKKSAMVIPGEQDVKKMTQAATKMCIQWNLKGSYEQAFKIKMAVKRNSDQVPATVLVGHLRPTIAHR